MEPPADPLEIRSPPANFDALIDWFDRISTNLVLLEEYPIADLEGAIRAFEAGVRTHVQRFEGLLGPTAPESGTGAGARSILRVEHAWFAVSMEQLDWCYGIVEHEDHGGHRQALGQYGRVFAEALRRHRRDERRYFPSADAESPRIGR
ncbi:MAG: hypothetical protein WB947_00505 [Thermoplasmata archaeon]